MAANPMPTDRLSTVDEQVGRVVESVRPLEPYDQPLLEALGLPVCENIVAPMDLPAFDNSAMDGYAVYFDDVATASVDHPVHRSVTSTSATRARTCRPATYSSRTAPSSGLGSSGCSPPLAAPRSCPGPGRGW